MIPPALKRVVSEIRSEIFRFIVDTNFYIGCLFLTTVQASELTMLEERYRRYVSAEDICGQFLLEKLGLEGLLEELAALGLNKYKEKIAAAAEKELQSPQSPEEEDEDYVTGFEALELHEPMELEQVSFHFYSRLLDCMYIK